MIAENAETAVARPHAVQASAEQAGGIACGRREPSERIPSEDDQVDLEELWERYPELAEHWVTAAANSESEAYSAAYVDALGADGVNMGTRFMATKEAPIHANIKQAIVNGDERGSTHIIRKFRNTSRVYKNSVALKIREIEARPDSTFADIADLVGGAGNKAAYQTGDIEAGTWSAGMVMGLINDIPTCKELLDGMVAEAKAIVEGRLHQAFA